MSDLSVNSNMLAFLNAKKILAFIQENGKDTSWLSWSGDGGSENEVALENIAASELATIRLPDFCTSIDVDSGDTLRNKHDIPDVLIMGGNAWSLPEYGDCSSVTFTLFIEEISAFLNIYLMMESGQRHYSRDYNYCCGFHVQCAQGNLMPDLYVPSSYKKMTSAPLEVEKFFVNLWKRYSLPDEKTNGWLETTKFEGRELGFKLEINCFDEIQRRVSDMVVDLIAKSPCDHYIQRAAGNSGGSASFEGEIHNVTEVGRELLRCVAKYNSYSTYELQYTYLGPRDWKDREKSRKKWKKPVHEQLGTVSLENGVVAGVSLLMEKEGYVFYLNFGCDDDLIKFYNSKLFQKTTWHSGAE